MLTVGIAIDSWKLPIFAQHLTKAGYSYTQEKPLSEDTLLLSVKTNSLVELESVIRAASAEAKEHKRLQ